MAEPVVSATILAYNRREELAETLETLLTQLTFPRGEALQIIVADNASTDGTAAMVRERFPSVELYESPENVGIEALNRASERARGDWILILDDDSHVSGDTLRQAVDAAREHDAQMVSLAIDSIDPAVAFSDTYRTGLLSFWGCGVLIAREAWERLGGYDGRMFIWGNELELTMRFLDAGYRHLVLPDAHAVHRKAVPPVQVPSHRRNMRNWGYVAGKLLQPRDAALAVGNLVVRAGIESLISPGYAAGALDALRGMRDGRRVREPVRPAVSRLYRRDFIEFTSQFRLLERLRHHLPLSGERPPNFREQFHRARPRLYPETSAALRVPRP